MEESIIYDLFFKSLLKYWREEAEKDTLECYDKQEKESEEELINELPERCKKTLQHYRLAIEERMDYLHYNLQVKILNYGIMLGLDLQKSFDELDEKK